MQVFTARLEANDNMKYLRTLEDWFDKLNDDGDFPKLLEVRDISLQEGARKVVFHRKDQSPDCFGLRPHRADNLQYLDGDPRAGVSFRSLLLLTTMLGLVSDGVLFSPFVPALQADVAHHSTNMEKQQALQYTGPPGGSDAGNLQ